MQPTPDLEGEPYKIVVIPRARRVHQSLLTTPVTALVSLLSCIYFITVQPFLQRKSRKSGFNQQARGTSSPPAGGADQNEVLVLNGPGTCLMLAAAVYLNRVSAFNPRRCPSPQYRGVTWRGDLKWYHIRLLTCTQSNAPSVVPIRPCMYSSPDHSRYVFSLFCRLKSLPENRTHFPI